MLKKKMIKLLPPKIFFQVAIDKMLSRTIFAALFLASFPSFAQQSVFIKAINQSTCYKPGDVLEIYGNNFGRVPDKKIIVVENDEGRQALPSDSWSDTEIVLMLPKKITTQYGRQYTLGIINSGHWVSNRDKSLLVCNKPQVAIQPALSLKPLVVERERIIPLSADPNKQLDGNKTINQASNTLTPLKAITPPTSQPSISQSLAPATPSVGRRAGSLASLGSPPKLDAVISSAKSEEQREPKEIIVVTASLQEALELEVFIKQYSVGIKRRNNYANLGIVVSVLRVPDQYETAELIQKLRQLDPNLWVDFNHRFQLLATPKSSDPKAWAYDAIAWSDRHRSCIKAEKIGLIDTGIAGLADFSQAAIVERSFLTSGVKAAKKSHGTAIASLLLGSSAKNIPGLLPDVNLYSASVFRQRTRKQIDTTAELIIKALSWMLDEKISVINLSLGGPRNLAVEIAVQRLLKRGVIVVSAAGVNRKGGALYPAAQKGVVAVRAIDADYRPFSKKIKGDYIDFSAPGVDLWLLNEKGKPRYQSGSSFAAPFIAASLLVLKKQKFNQKISPYDRLKNRPTDLGEKGKDAHFGWGLVSIDGC